MSRKANTTILACLLSLLPVLSFAQSLQRIEYWFDDNFSSRSTISVSGSEDGVTKAISTDGMDNGVHKFSFRVRRSDGMYSPISTSVFFKQNDNVGEVLEYWLDDDYEHRVGMTLSGTTDEQELTFDLHDMEWCPLGFHRLNFRVATEGKGMSAVYTTGIVKLPLGTATQVEYWFDGDQANSQLLDGHLSSDGKAYIINTDIDVSQLSVGMHRISYRACDKANSLYGAVLTEPILKVPSGNASILEYWLDGDMSTKRQFSATSTNASGYQFASSLDLGTVAPGHHRLSVRAKSADGNRVTSVTSTPIIVKSKYNVKNPEELKVAEYAYWIDDEEPAVVPVSNPKSIINQPLTLDARQYSDGQHTLHVQFGNSADIWNAPYDSVFNKTPVSAPVIASNATVENGIVTLKYSTVPFGIRYQVVRQYPSGTLRKVDQQSCTEYPAILQAIDTPAPGTYTYYIEGIYTDVDGQTQRVRSGDMAVTVDQAASTVGKGTFVGLVTVNGERFEDYTKNYYTVTVNGQPAKESVYQYSRLRNCEGNFMISGIPYGTELTVGIKYENYGFNDVKLIVNEHTIEKTYRFNCNSEDLREEQLDDDASDLSLINGIELTPDAWELSVKNKYRYTPWSGNIIVKAISKKVMDMYDREAEEGLPWWYFIRHPYAGLDEGPNYKTIASTHISLDKKEYKELALNITDIPRGYDDDDREFYVCIFSQKDGSDELKPLAGGGRQTLNFDPANYIPAGDVTEHLINEYKMIMRYLYLMKDWGDPFALEMNTLGDDIDDIINNLGNGTYNSDGIKKDIIVNGSHGAGLLLGFFIDDVNNNIVKDVRRYGKNIIDQFRISDGISEVYQTLKSFYDLHDVDENHKSLETIKLVMQVADKLKNKAGIKYPAFDVYKSYFEVADAMVNVIDKFELSVQGGDIYEKLSKGKGIYEIKVRKYTSDGSIDYFNPQYVYEQIKDITFTLTTDTDFKLESEPCKVDTDGNELKITNISFNHETNNTLYSTLQMWMTINWKNNRVTRIPMLEKHFAKIRDLNTQNPTMTVELQSGTNLILEHMANKLTIINQK